MGTFKVHDPSFQKSESPCIKDTFLGLDILRIALPVRF